MLSIMNNMSDEALMEALSAVGIEQEADDFALGMESEEGIPGWNEQEVQISAPNKPSLVDALKFVKPKETRIPRPDYDDAMGLEEFVPQTNLPLEL
jgi:hypothetical protein